MRVDPFSTDRLGLRPAIDLYRLDQQSRRLSPATITGAGYQLRPFVAYLEGMGVSDVSEITSDHVRRYLASRSDLKAWSLHSAAKILKTWLRFLAREADAGSPRV